MSLVPIFEEWREAQREALQTEPGLPRAQFDQCPDRAPPPDPQTVRHTRMLQARSHSLFVAAMAHQYRP